MGNKKDPFAHEFFTNPDKYRRKHISRLIILLAAMSIMVWICLTKIGGELDKRTTEIKSLVGKKVIIDKDTLTIIDYSILNTTYQLSNGLNYNITFINSKIHNK